MSNIKLYIGSELADFSEAFNVMFSIGDIRNLGFGNSNKTYTLNLPLTKTNKRLLKFINQVDVKSEPSATARLYLGELLIISGSISISGSSDYYAKVIIDSDDWIDALKDKKMTELDLSASDHTLNHAGVEDSWTASYPMYRYPMIDFGALVSAEYGITAKWYPNDFIPMISVAQLIAKILAPYTISSTWIGTTFIKNLFVLAREQVADSVFIQNKQLNVVVALDVDNQDANSIPASTPGISALSYVKIDFNTETKDEGSDWSTNTYTVPEAGTYKFKTALTGINSAKSDPNFTITYEEVIISIMRKRGAAIITLNNVTAAAYAGTELVHDVLYNLETPFYHCEAGDEIYVEVYISCSATNNDSSAHDLTVAIKNVSTFENVWNAVNRHAGLTKTISLEEMLPDIKQVDFLAAIRDICNLRFWFDKMKRTIYIEPWDSFLSSTVVDLTSFIDFESIDTNLIAPNYSKTIRLKWREDSSDAAFTEYMKLNLIGPGSKDITLTSLYAKNGEVPQEHPFSSIITGPNMSIGQYAVSTPRIWNSVPASPYNMFDRKTGFNTRIVEWKGLTAGFTWYYETETKTDYPKIQGLDFATLYADYWMKMFHYIDKGKLLTVKMKIKPTFLTQFFTVVNTATSEGFRPTYLITIKGIKNYFFLQKITSDGITAELELVLKQ